MTFSATSADERVLDVRFTGDAISVDLRDGRVITAPLVWYPRLLNASAAQRRNWKIAGGGYGIHWPDLDEDLSTEGLLRGASAPGVASQKTRPRSIGASPNSRTAATSARRKPSAARRA